MLISKSILDRFFSITICIKYLFGWTTAGNYLDKKLRRWYVMLEIKIRLAIHKASDLPTVLFYLISKMYFNGHFKKM